MYIDQSNAYNSNPVFVHKMKMIGLNVQQLSVCDQKISNMS